MGSKKNVNMSTTEDTVKIVANPEAVTDTLVVVAGDAAEATTEVTAQPDKTKKVKKSKPRSAKYTMVRSQVDKTKMYDSFAAIELVKKLSYSKFDGTVTVDAVIKEAGDTIGVTFPHSTGRVVRVEIVTDDLISQIEAGNIDFDILITEPRFMPKLARLAKILGPKGLMPNPKNGTITDNPELKKKELEGGKTQIKAEKKAPLMHVTIGKVSMETKDLVENLNALIEALTGKVVKLSVSATMSPSIKVMVS